MSAFERCNGISAKSLRVLLPFIEEHAYNGRFIITDKGPIAKFLQAEIGDAAMNTADGRSWTIEIKSEETYRGTLFLETWSNKNLNLRYKHGEFGSKPGWMLTLRTDLLFYHFISVDMLFIADFFRLKQWAFGNDNHQGKIYAYPEKCQRRHGQPNDTWGRCVPVKDLIRDIGMRCFSPKQFSLDLDRHQSGAWIAEGE